MTEEIIIAGFGGQGVLLAGKLLCVAAMRQGRHVSHIPSYGAEMRGGTANCSLIISDDPIASPLVESPTVVIALNGPSVLKFEPRVRSGGILIRNTSLVKAAPERSDIHQVPVEATGIAAASGAERGANMAALGALLKVRPNLMTPDAAAAALDEVVSARNRKFNSLNRQILQSGFNECLLLPDSVVSG